LRSDGLREYAVSEDAGDKKRGLKEEVDALREEAADLLGGLKQIFSASRDEVVRSALLGRLRVDIYQQKKERAALLQSLGEEVFELVRQGKRELPELQATLEGLEALDASIATIQEQIEEGQSPLAADDLSVAQEEVGAAASSETPEEPAKKKPAVKKPAVKKPAAKKPAAKKSAVKKAAPSKKPVAKKSSGSKKTAAKKTPTSKKGTPKKGAGKTAKGS
jgi:septal ring-binding cell division protein DamX